MEMKRSRFFFEGGNIVVSDGYVITGYSTIDALKHMGESSAIRLLEREFGKKVIVVGSEDVTEPHEHVDMYLTPINDSLVLLADPTLAMDLLSEGLARPATPSSDPDGTGVRDEYEIEENGTVDLFEADDLIASYWHVKCQLERKGLAVERLPIIHLGEECALTYNNVLMETRAGRRIVYMPVYAVGALDRAAAELYKSLGFEVRPVDVTRIYEYGGTIRCLTNILARKATSIVRGNSELQH